MVPIVISLVRPRSVVDVGCGSGAWLLVFRENGIERILGLDGHHIDPSWLVIPRECYRAVDLSKAFEVDEKFDLAVCLEVAEHLPKRRAQYLVGRLVNLAPIVLFSAAVPFQGGTHHVNEQWPEFWNDVFGQNGYRPLDLIRVQTWKNPEVKYWYRQNMFLYVLERLIATNPIFLEATRYADDLMLVHRSILHHQTGLRSIFKQLPRSVWDATLRRLKMISKRSH